ncbi:MAG: lipopolysaccharide biosynthesis protein [Eggerthella lenta]
MDRITRNDTKHGSHAKQPTEPLHDDTVIDETPAPSDTTPFLGASSRERQATSKRRKPNFITKGVNRWCNRLLGAVSERSLADQEEEYAAHRTTRDYVWNTVGVGAWGMVFPILTVVVTQLVGVEQAGMFSLAFVTGTLLMILANYGVRTYQVSDVTEEHSFSDYQINRLITCAFMVLVGVAYCMVRGYESQMFTISLGVYLYKMVDGLADVYEGRLQQVDKLYLSGVSQAFRSVVVLVVFSLCLLITRNLAVSCIVMAVAAIATFLVLTFPLAMFETPKSKRWNFGSIVELFKQCFPLFIALFLYAFIDNMPKFVMEGVLSYDNQLYFNALYSQGSVDHRPGVQAAGPHGRDVGDPEKRGGSTSIAVSCWPSWGHAREVVSWDGSASRASFMYGLTSSLQAVLHHAGAGGVTAAIDFLYQVITVLRRQRPSPGCTSSRSASRCSFPSAGELHRAAGRSRNYLIVMCILLVLLVSVRLRRFARRRPPRKRHARSPSAMRAERSAANRARERRGPRPPRDARGRAARIGQAATGRSCLVWGAGPATAGGQPSFEPASQPAARGAAAGSDRTPKARVPPGSS